MFKFNFDNLYAPIAESASSQTIEEALSEIEPSSDNEDEKITPDHELTLDPPDEEVESDDENDPEDGYPEDLEEEKDNEKDELDLESEDEDLELASVPKRAAIKAKYPNIFKDFPALDHIIGREHAFAEIFPTVGEAKQAKESVVQLNSFESDLLDGNIENVLMAVNKSNPAAFKKISDNIIENLLKIDSNAHVVTTQKITKGILTHIHNSALASLKRNPNDERSDQLRIASELIHETLFDSPDVQPYQSKKLDEVNPELDKLKKDREQFESTRFQSAYQSITNKVNIRLNTAVSREVDKSNVMTPYLKTKVVADIMKSLDEQLSSDTRFRNTINRLWEKAKSEVYSATSMDRIQKALEEQAKPILPSIIRAKRGEAIKGLGTVKRKEEQPRINRENRAPSKEKLTSSKHNNDRNVPRENESNYDFLMRD